MIKTGLLKVDFRQKSVNRGFGVLLAGACWALLLKGETTACAFLFQLQLPLQTPGLDGFGSQPGTHKPSDAPLLSLSTTAVVSVLCSASAVVFTSTWDAKRGRAERGPDA